MIDIQQDEHWAENTALWDPWLDGYSENTNEYKLCLNDNKLVAILKFCARLFHNLGPEHWQLLLNNWVLCLEIIISLFPIERKL